MRTPKKEEQVEFKSEGMSRVIRGQSSAGRRAEESMRQRAGRAGTNSAHGLWTSRSLNEGKGGVIRSRRVGRRAAHRAGQKAIWAGRRGCIGKPLWRAGQGQGRVRGIPREGRKKKTTQMTELGHVGGHERGRMEVRSENRDRAGEELSAG